MAMDILSLLQSSEGKTLEFKRDLSSHEGVLRALVAFANTSGGILLIGVEDKTRKVVGVGEPLQLEERLANIISDGIYPKLVPNIEIIPWRKKYLISVEVYPSSARPHYLKNKSLEKGSYVRIGSTNRLADSIMIREMQRFTSLETYDEQPMAELNSEAIDFRAASEQFSEYRRLKQADFETLRLLTKEQGRLVPTQAGIILFGKNREKYFPDAWIQVGRFDGENRNNIIDSQEIRDYPAVAVEQTIQFIKKHSLRALKISSTKRKDEWSVPIVAIREAIVNAIVHMDYAQKGSPIRVSVYNDRIEIENPGLIPFNLTLDDLYRGISKLRNPIIGRIFHELKLIERWGSGIRRMIDACLDAGLDKPILEEIGPHFRVTLFTVRKNPQKVDERDKEILNILKNSNGLSTQQIADKIRLSSRATRSRMISLGERGLVIEVGSGPKDPKRKYFLTQGK